MTRTTECSVAIYKKYSQTPLGKAVKNANVTMLRSRLLHP